MRARLAVISSRIAVWMADPPALTSNGPQAPLENVYFGSARATRKTNAAGEPLGLPMRVAVTIRANETKIVDLKEE